MALSDGHAVYTGGVSENRGGVISFRHDDTLGSVRFTTNPSQAVTANLLGDAFGEPISGSGALATPLRFAGGSGCSTDADTGIVLMGHRYYDSRLGRFLSQDPIQAGENWYTYANNSPTNAVDPTGLETTFNVPGNWSQAQVEAYTWLNYGDGTYDVQNGKNSYTFTLATQQPSNMGFALGLGVAGQFADGGHNHSRNYGATSTQAKNMQTSSGYKNVLSQIAAGQKHGKVGTGRAFLYSLIDGANGTQWQLGAFDWRFTDPNNSNMGIDILNDITYNSLAYHLPETLNKMGALDPMSFLSMDRIANGDFGFPTQWSSGNFGSIHQKIHLNFP